MAANARLCTLIAVVCVQYVERRIISSITSIHIYDGSGDDDDDDKGNRSAGPVRVGLGPVRDEA